MFGLCGDRTIGGAPDHPEKFPEGAGIVTRGRAMEPGIWFTDADGLEGGIGPI